MPAVAGHIGGIPDLLRNIVEDPAVPNRAVVVDERLPSDDLDFAFAPEILAGDAALLLKIDEFEHDDVLYLKTILRIRTSEPGYRAEI